MHPVRLAQEPLTPLRPRTPQPKPLVALPIPPIVGSFLTSLIGPILPHRAAASRGGWRSWTGRFVRCLQQFSVVLNHCRLSRVVAGLVPATSILLALCSKRSGSPGQARRRRRDVIRNDRIRCSVAAVANIVRCRGDPCGRLRFATLMPLTRLVRRGATTRVAPTAARIYCYPESPRPSLADVWITHAAQMRRPLPCKGDRGA